MIFVINQIEEMKIKLTCLGFGGVFAIDLEINWFYTFKCLPGKMSADMKMFPGIVFIHCEDNTGCVTLGFFK